jgi:endo-1,4-beta-xylanase
MVISAGALHANTLEPDLFMGMPVITQKLPVPTPTPTINPRPPLRSLAERHGIQVGVAVARGWLQDPDYAALLLREFNAVTPENAMKWDTIHPEPNRYDFSQGDAIVEFARQNGLKVRGHTLVWFNQLPQWVVEGDYTREEWIDILRQHIYTVVGHYRSTNNDHTVVAWDVVNEAVAKNGSLFDSFWLQKIGPEYIPLAFQFAREADPDALLFYNDNGGEGLNPKSQGIYNLVKGLVQAGIPIDGVGLQMHTALGVAPSTNELATNIQRLTDLGLQVHFTEMDVRIQNSTDPLAVKLQNQAEVYRQTIEACLLFINCNGFFTWGLTDRFSWIPAYTGVEDYPLLFDDNYQPKPALDAMLDVLESK